MPSVPDAQKRPEKPGNRECTGRAGRTAGPKASARKGPNGLASKKCRQTEATTNRRTMRRPSIQGTLGVPCD
jgi:hypothetical protein